ncbi:methyl-accepting chemotaxis protein [Anoxynatronum buryatiense]|uniref:Methyl-accepting chemotaxis protein n=1 Tax=Anoxynatronum buryatiense TaxID=489973 RepID=A0AA45WWP9_9CLOT|nr:methyl-accepting chemotaxis protein [Anoxynatronum buryatiense]SMP58798.1 methyl-accepting chemotaxis protein [Anoxynatronum buryatiense]
MSLRKKFLSGIGISVIAVMLLMTLMVSRSVAGLIEAKEREHHHLLTEAVDAQMQAQLDSARMSVVSIANNAQVQELFAQRDREALLEQLMPVYETLQNEVAQIQFHLPDSTAFLRLHMPENFGDSLRDFRFTVNEANEKKAIVQGLEEGRGGYGFRVVVPMSHQGQHTGSVEYGSNFGNQFLENLKQQFGGDYFIYTLTDESVSWQEGQEENIFLAGTLETDRWQESLDMMTHVMNGEWVSQVSEDENQSVLLIPYKDYQGNVGGYIKAILDRSAIVAQSNGMTRMLYLLTAGVTVLLSLIMFLFLNSAILRPVNRMKTLIAAVEQGDFTVECQGTSKDEIGQLADSFNQMVRTVREMIGDISGAALKVSDASATLQQTALENTRTTEEVAKAVEGIAQGAVDQAERTEEGAQKSQAMGRIMEENQQLTATMNQTNQQATRVVAESLKNMEQLTHIYETTVQAMEAVRLGIQNTDSSSRRISDASGMIAAISEQTNLLALNAAIEAARAGEAGRGFAVVADEIRKLAEESNASTKTIDQVVEDLQQHSKEAVQTIENSFEVLHRLQSEISRNQQAFHQIAQSSQDSHEQMKALNASTEQLEKMKQEILDAIQSLAAIAEENSASTEEVSASVEEQSASMMEIAQASDSLAELSQHLQEKMSQFRA